MNEDFRARLMQKAQAIKAQRDAEAEEIITLQDLKQQAEENANTYFEKLNAIRDAVKSIGVIPTLSESKKLFSAIQNIVDT